MVIPMETKSYILSCEKCNITEYMVFMRLPQAFRFRCMDGTEVSFDGDDIIEKEKVFKPIHGIFGDKPPKRCPKCGNKLKCTGGPRLSPVVH